MVDAGVYAKFDDDIIMHAAKTLVLIAEAENLLTESGQIQSFKTGARQIAPEMANLRGLKTDFLKYVSALGLSPAARAKLKVEKKEEKPVNKMSIMRLAK